ncbi:hypothetical protein PG997_005196 [Apiospora hydei]|uniref:Uncharacterized protein n=1 Tax=Apiospora hydei TaxID=1337664 RepID=A0ABR1X4A9_9PEZI
MIPRSHNIQAGTSRRRRARERTSAEHLVQIAAPSHGTIVVQGPAQGEDWAGDFSAYCQTGSPTEPAPRHDDGFLSCVYNIRIRAWTKQDDKKQGH